MDTSIESAIKTSTRKVLLTSIAALVIVGLVIWGKKDYFYNVFYGPFPKSVEQLASISDLANEREVFVKVVGDTVLDSGFYRSETQTNTTTHAVVSKSIIAYYHLLLVGHKFLVVSSERPDYSTERTGELLPIESGLRKMLAESADTNYDSFFYPFLLDTKTYSTFAILGLFVLIPATALSVVGIAKSVRYYIEPSKHPLYRSAESERTWLEVHQGQEYAELAPSCDRCGYHKRLFRSEYRSNVSYIFRRQEQEIDGNYCMSCNTHLFVRFTLTTFIGTWWGIIGMILGPIYILKNIFNYVRAFGKSLLPERAQAHESLRSAK